MFSKILIANRGEIACRIMRTARRMGIATVAVYSDADRHALHVKMADEAVSIGPAPAADSYNLIENIMAAIRETGAQAVHPGYGFLAENTAFAEICESNDIIFIGPSAKVIAEMGNKAKAKETMMKAGLPVIPGSKGIVKDANEAEKIANDIGFPVLLKAVSGGGGKGMRVVFHADEVKKQFPIAQNEAEINFGDGSIYLEKFFKNPRHIEIQILGDNFGNIIHLGERDCSIQRRHQ